VKTFIDTNVLIYWVDYSVRADVVEQLLAQDCVISVQVLNEFANVLRRKHAMALQDIEVLCTILIPDFSRANLVVYGQDGGLTYSVNRQTGMYV
jgi:predicted nucleic acid-binding protein